MNDVSSERDYVTNTPRAEEQYPYRELAVEQVRGTRSQSPGVVAAKGQLNLALASAIQEAQALANYYDNVAKQLTLLASQVEHTK